MVSVHVPDSDSTQTVTCVPCLSVDYATFCLDLRLWGILSNSFIGAGVPWRFSPEIQNSLYLFCPVDSFSKNVLRLDPWLSVTSRVGNSIFSVTTEITTTYINSPSLGSPMGPRTKFKEWSVNVDDKNYSFTFFLTSNGNLSSPFIINTDTSMSSSGESVSQQNQVFSVILQSSSQLNIVFPFIHFIVTGMALDCIIKGHIYNHSIYYIQFLKIVFEVCYYLKYFIKIL